MTRRAAPAYRALAELPVLTDADRDGLPDDRESETVLFADSMYQLDLHGECSSSASLR